ncbi:FCD domain-containing protein [Rhodococcus antarcticus]|uniref:FCD domain-containing protein n=1 Tax=Rhodococcus antarcticus TaxID=2987751 RepID=A0ABY6NVW7_9NOCA|nr:FCD domain-containing protein [Rhodococcus antarcticus]UZJ23448.1 FCD domain-containing protein [Rhodococcus antarcticus]
MVVERGSAQRAGGLHARLLDDLGTAIAEGRTPAGSVLRIEDLEARFCLSRTVVREAVRVLESLGMVTSRRRVGLTVQPSRCWSVYDPKVIRWRLAGSGRADQLRSLTALRSAVEPLAASGAATHIDPVHADELVDTAAALESTGREGDLVAFLALDLAFHRAVLAHSGNEMFAALDGAVAAVLTGRTEHGLVPANPEPRALALHVEVARAVRAGEPVAAEAAMRALTAESTAGLDVLP